MLTNKTVGSAYDGIFSRRLFEMLSPFAIATQFLTTEVSITHQRSGRPPFRMQVKHIRQRGSACNVDTDRNQKRCDPVARHRPFTEYRNSQDRGYRGG